MSGSEGAALRRVVLRLLATPGKARFGLGWITPDGVETSVRTFITRRDGSVAATATEVVDVPAMSDALLMAAREVRQAFNAIIAAIEADAEHRRGAHGVPE